MKSFIILLLTLFSYTAYGQTLKEPEVKVNALPQKAGDEKMAVNGTPGQYVGTSMLSDRSVYLSMSILIFGGIIFIILLILTFYSKIDSAAMIKISTVVLICISSLFLVLAGYSSNQIAPAFGLLGTLAGYLLGKNNND